LQDKPRDDDNDDDGDDDNDDHDGDDDDGLHALCTTRGSNVMTEMLN